MPNAPHNSETNDSLDQKKVADSESFSWNVVKLFSKSREINNQNRII